MSLEMVGGFSGPEGGPPVVLMVLLAGSAGGAVPLLWVVDDDTGPSVDRGGPPGGAGSVDLAPDSDPVDLDPDTDTVAAVGSTGMASNSNESCIEAVGRVDGEGAAFPPWAPPVLLAARF